MECSWRFNRPQSQLAQRGKSPACGQVENRFPLLIREIVFLKISSRFVEFATGRRVCELTLDI